MNDIVKREPAPAQGLDNSLMQLLADPKITPEKMQVILQARREILAERRVEAFKQAFVAMAAKLPKVDKNGVVELKTKEGKFLGRYTFAMWEDMDDALRPILQDFGFALTFAETPTANGHVQIRGELMHIDGHSINSERNMPPDRGPGRNDLQAQGSAISYAKRYLAEELLNIVRKGQDDDGRKAVPKPISAAQVRELSDLVKAVKTKPETFLRLFVTGAEKMEDIQERDFPRLINALKEKQRSMGEK